MKNYLDLLRRVVETGISTKNRTNTDTLSLTGETLKWNLSKGFPIITSRKISFKISFEETLFFLRGETLTKNLEE